jgi:hypothetical protein
MKRRAPGTEAYPLVPKLYLGTRDRWNSGRIVLVPKLELGNEKESLFERIIS